MFLLEVDQAVGLIEDLIRQKAAGIEVQVVTHVAADADAIVSAALVKIVKILSTDIHTVLFNLNAKES